MHHFEFGQEYLRKSLMAYVGSKQRQSGVLWGADQPGCLVCTSGGRHGKKAGYSDERLDDGTWWYFGQGQQGDQDLRNSANARLADGGLSVLLFSAREPTTKEVTRDGHYGKRFSYCGLFNVANFEFFRPDSGSRRGDNLLRFRLVPVDGYGYSSPDTLAAQSDRELSLGELSRQLSADVAKMANASTAIKIYRSRSVALRAYAIRRANGTCEACGTPGPFLADDGGRFLEVHHLTRLADDGPDKPQNVAAICPNCHRRAHHSSDRQAFGESLKKAVWAIEAAILREK